MNLWQAIIMGIVQGLTEFLPVSSSGHLVIARILLNANVDTSAFFEVLLHVGTLAAVFVVLWKDVKSLIIEVIKLIKDGVLYLVKKKPFTVYTERKVALMVILASIPTAILGLIAEKFLEDIFLSSLVAVGFSLLITASVLLLSKKIPQGHKKADRMKWQDGLFIGLAQGVATLPGISRSGLTTTAGIFCGMDRDFAFRFSFLVSIPAIVGATLLKAFTISSSDMVYFGNYMVGMIVAGLVGYVAMIWLRKLVVSNKFHYFGYYCLAVGAFSVIAGFIL